MGGHYEKGVFDQLMEVMGRIETMETQQKKDRQEIRLLTSEVTALRKENARFRSENEELRTKVCSLEKENATLQKQLCLFQDDNERMKRSIQNDSSNSSKPPSGDPPTKPPNTYNGRKKTKKKKGAQPGHKGVALSKEEVEQKIQDGIFLHRVEEIGDAGRPYVTRYRIDLEIKAVATEIRIHADENGRYQIPVSLRANVAYGNGVKAIIAFLYSEGVVANDRICTFINSLSGGALGLSTGSVYGFCREVSGLCRARCHAIRERLLNARVVCTDATPITTDGKQTYIRNFSTKDAVLYYSTDKKDLAALRSMDLLRMYVGILVHDHETALYHFGTGHGECAVHLARYLLKNTEETGNSWSRYMRSFLLGMNHARKERMGAGSTSFTEEEIARYMARYDELIAMGREQNKGTKGRVARKEERALLNRMEKYKDNYLLFLRDFQVPFSNNMSEKDLRICKNRQKMAGGFRNAEGRQMYCDIQSFVETVKRRGLGIYESLVLLLNGSPVFY